MKKIYLLLAGLFLVTVSFSQVVFTDDFESGTSQWVLTGNWAIDNQFAASGNSLTEDPGWYSDPYGGTGGYLANNNSTATMATGVDLSSAINADLSFWVQYHLEPTFDFMYLEVSTNGGTSWQILKTYDQANVAAYTENVSLGGFVGFADVKIRFRFSSDGAYQEDGMWIDDFTITVSNDDLAAPFIAHSGPVFYEGTLGDFITTAEIIDVSGIASAEIIYTVDGGAATAATYTAVNSNEYTFTIPTQPSGSLVEYYIKAVDGSAFVNADSTTMKKYVAGNHIIQDNGVVDFYGAFGPNSTSAAADGIAVKVELGATDITYALVRAYTSVGLPNDDVEFHIWDDNGGFPGADVITPFMITPEATVTNTSAMTKVDLRPYSAQLSNLTGTYYLGFIVPTGLSHTTMTDPGSFNVSYYWSGTAWSAVDARDYHIRAVTTENTDVVGPNIVNNTMPAFFEGSLTNTVVSASITDQTGVASATLYYSVDGAAAVAVTGVNTGGDVYTFDIPMQDAGTWVSYYIEATDMVTPTALTTTTVDYEYIAGNYVAQDDDVPNFYGFVGGTQGYPAIMCEYSIPTGYETDIVAMLIRNYYDATFAVADMRILVMTDTAFGGTNLITPIDVTPEANAGNITAYTRVDLRPFSAELSGLTGSVFFGFQAATDSIAFLLDQPGTFGKSYYNDYMNWIATTDDYNLRVITSDLIVGVEEILAGAKVMAFPNPMTNSTTIEVDAGETAQNMTLEVYNLLGEKMQVQYTANMYSFELQRGNLANGTYIYKVYSEKESIGEGKLVIR